MGEKDILVFGCNKKAAVGVSSKVGGMLMKNIKWLVLLAPFLLGGCMATFEPDGVVHTSYVVPNRTYIEYRAPRPAPVRIAKIPRPTLRVAPGRIVEVHHPKHHATPGRPGKEPGPGHHPGHGRIERGGHSSHHSFGSGHSGNHSGSGHSGTPSSSAKMGGGSGPQFHSPGRGGSFGRVH